MTAKNIILIIAAVVWGFVVVVSVIRGDKEMIIESGASGIMVLCIFGVLDLFDDVD